jgi:DNA-binding transcriptional LysR family regulator
LFKLFMGDGLAERTHVENDWFWMNYPKMVMIGRVTTSPRMLDGDSLAAFVVFAEQLNFTHAAARLHVSQPALHARIRKLADQLEVALYRREGRQLALTDAGRELLRFARELDGRTRELHASLHGTKPTAPVTLAAGEGSFLYLLGEPIRRFVRRGAAPLRLLTRNREQMLAALREGEAQLGVGAVDLVPDELESSSLCEVAQVLVMPSKHPLARKRTIRLEQLAGARMIVAPSGRPHRRAFAQAMLAAGVEWELAVETHGWPAMLHFVRLGVGLAVVNGSVKIPPGCVGRAIPELPTTRYRLLRAARLSDAASELADLIEASAGAMP